MYGVKRNRTRMLRVKFYVDKLILLYLHLFNYASHLFVICIVILFYFLNLSNVAFSLIHLLALL